MEALSSSTRSFQGQPVSCKGREQGGVHVGGFTGQTQKRCTSIPSYVVGQNAVTWPHPIARKSVKCVAVWPRKKSNQQPLL